jgi:ribosomal protein S14
LGKKFPEQENLAQKSSRQEARCNATNPTEMVMRLLEFCRLEACIIFDFMFDITKP